MGVGGRFPFDPRIWSKKGLVWPNHRPRPPDGQIGRGSWARIPSPARPPADLETLTANFHGLVDHKHGGRMKPNGNWASTNAEIAFVGPRASTLAPEHRLRAHRYHDWNAASTKIAGLWPTSGDECHHGDR